MRERGSSLSGDARLESMERRLEALQNEVDRLRAAGETDQRAEDRERARITRRRLFRVAGGAAVGALAAGAFGNQASSALATNGSALIAGQSTTDTAMTSVTGSVLNGPALLVSNYLTSGFDGYSDAFQAYTFGAGLAAIYGRNDAVGGSSINGFSANGTGGMFKGGLAPIRLQPAASAGAPTTFNHLQGELYVDSLGNLYICTVSGDGSHTGTFKEVATTDLGLHLLPAPKTIWANSTVSGTVYTGLDALHATDGSSTGVPAGAQAAYCVGYGKPFTSVGTLTFYADGTTDPTFPNFGCATTGGYTVSPILVPLSAAGKYAMHAHDAIALTVYVWAYVL